MEQQQISAKKLKAMEKVKRANAELAKVIYCRIETEKVPDKNGESSFSILEKIPD